MSPNYILNAKVLSLPTYSTFLQGIQPSCGAFYCPVKGTISDSNEATEMLRQVPKAVRCCWKTNVMAAQHIERQ